MTIASRRRLPVPAVGSDLARFAYRRGLSIANLCAGRRPGPAIMLT